MEGDRESFFSGKHVEFCSGRTSVVFSEMLFAVDDVFWIQGGEGAVQGFVMHISAVYQYAIEIKDDEFDAVGMRCVHYTLCKECRTSLSAFSLSDTLLHVNIGIFILKNVFEIRC